MSPVCFPEPRFLDPLLLSVFAPLFQKNLAPWLLIVGMTAASTAIALTLALMIRSLFWWKYSRNLHTTCIGMTLGASLFTFISVLKTRVTVSSALYTIRTVSLQVVSVERGKLSEAFLWLASAIWFLTFLFMTWVRLWNLANMRAKKEDAVIMEEEEEESRTQQLLPRSTESISLPQLAAAQM